VLIVGSGNFVHNLRKIRRAMGEAGYDWVQRFDQDTMAVMLDDPSEVAGLTGHPDFAAAAPVGCQKSGLGR
jgi:4,5-DOPA dioxygenase extradiol